MIYKADNNVRQKLVEMFDDFDSTIVLSYLQGHMGNAWVDNLENPTVAQITVGIFVFYAGNQTQKRRKNYYIIYLILLLPLLIRMNGKTDRDCSQRIN